MISARSWRASSGERRYMRRKTCILKTVLKEQTLVERDNHSERHGGNEGKAASRPQGSPKRASSIPQKHAHDRPEVWLALRERV